MPCSCRARPRRIKQSTLHALLEVMRQRDSIHRRAGSVHGCALFRNDEMLMVVEDVGRHNAIDTIAGWKAAQMGVPIIVSRNGVTQMGHEMASKLGMTLFGRAANRHFICYTGFERFDREGHPGQPPYAVSEKLTAVKLDL